MLNCNTIQCTRVLDLSMVPCVYTLYFESLEPYFFHFAFVYWLFQMVGILCLILSQ